jgi:hypothetical protein
MSWSRLFGHDGGEVKVYSTPAKKPMPEVSAHQGGDGAEVVTD